MVRAQGLGGKVSQKEERNNFPLMGTWKRIKLIKWEHEKEKKLFFYWSRKNSLKYIQMALVYVVNTARKF